MVVLGVLLLGVTLKYPPYFDDTTDESNSKRWYQRSGANRLRVAIDLAVLWTYICALVAVVAHTGNTSTSSSDGTPSYYEPVLFLRISVFVCCSCCRL